MTRRVVITGMGAVAPGSLGVDAFREQLRAGRSGIRHLPELEESDFACQVAGVPEHTEAKAAEVFAPDQISAMNSNHRFASLAAIEAWEDAGLEVPSADDDAVDWRSGALVGTGIGGMDTVGERVVPLTNAGKVRRIGATAVEQVMTSGISARIGGLLALGNRVSTNSSACATGTEAIIEAAWHIREGRADRMVCGGSEGASRYTWAGFDSMRVLARGWNEDPTAASRPMSASASGFVPAAGAGVLILESLESARARGARIRGEFLGGALVCGGHRGGGSMTAPNPEGVRRCISDALVDAQREAVEVDAVNGHLTATAADPREMRAWSEALGRKGSEMVPITSTKSMIGHALGAAGGLEAVASILMLEGGFVHASINCTDVHPEIAPFADAIPHEMREMPDLRVLAKASFGFGDVNACIVLGRAEGE